MGFKTASEIGYFTGFELQLELISNQLNKFGIRGFSLDFSNIIANINYIGNCRKGNGTVCTDLSVKFPVFISEVSNF